MCRILIAEDEPRIAAFIEKGLRKHGYQTVVVHSGIQVVEVAQAVEFDLLLLDLGLPGKDGWTVLQELRQQLPHFLSVIIVTARDDIQDRLISLDFGVTDYITKPFRFTELLSRVEAKLGKAQ
ncbi:response regulator transcription factor [Leptolyngbya sp. NK1-12]|uniref:Response regulator transcription factor n=1 Tax=Leptolyngbya sp. NK1-12 TaxID=2547451 RepID=A0AA97AHW0_9CYAN|nr:response regulator transcription factor [Leptolyngbya sp. NK1-12]WNZ21452.1 response regulator transcription factor [Leptolyngbya sp. NK1-12]